jgi:hypothetical protein
VKLEETVSRLAQQCRQLLACLQVRGEAVALELASDIESSENRPELSRFPRSVRANSSRKMSRALMWSNPLYVSLHNDDRISSPIRVEIKGCLQVCRVESRKLSGHPGSSRK